MVIKIHLEGVYEVEYMDYLRGLGYTLEGGYVEVDSRLDIQGLANEWLGNGSCYDSMIDMIKYNMIDNERFINEIEKEINNYINKIAK